MINIIAVIAIHRTMIHCNNPRLFGSVLRFVGFLYDTNHTNVSASAIKTDVIKIKMTRAGRKSQIYRIHGSHESQHLLWICPNAVICHDFSQMLHFCVAINEFFMLHITNWTLNGDLVITWSSESCFYWPTASTMTSHTSCLMQLWLKDYVS